MSQFALNDKVTWTSQAGGHTKKKTGTVVQVVPTGMLPSGQFSPRQPGSERRHESYVVHVPTASGRGKGQYYWPVRSLLKPAT
jgi:hypothetical protein